VRGHRHGAVAAPWLLGVGLKKSQAESRLCQKKTNRRSREGAYGIQWEKTKIKRSSSKNIANQPKNGQGGP